MPPAKTWIMDFLKAHRMRYAIDDFPDFGTIDSREFVKLWLYQFDSNHVTEAEAHDASVALGATPPGFRPDHIPAIMGMIRRARAEKANAPKPLAKVQHGPPLPPPTGFKTWQKWVRAGCPEFEDSGTKTATAPSTTPAPQPKAAISGMRETSGQDTKPSTPTPAAAQAKTGCGARRQIRPPQPAGASTTSESSKSSRIVPQGEELRHPVLKIIHPG
jgi:hypothetical protein